MFLKKKFCVANCYITNILLKTIQEGGHFFKIEFGNLFGFKVSELKAFQTSKP